MSQRSAMTFVFLLALALALPAAASHRPAQPLSRLVADADFIMIVEAVAPAQVDIDGEQLEAWSYVVDAQLKGLAPPPLLATEGFISGDGLDCCTAGARYLLFARDGGPDNFVERDGEVWLHHGGEGRVVSTVFGPIGLLEIVDGRVQWPTREMWAGVPSTAPSGDFAGGADADGQLALAEAVARIRAEMAQPLPADALLERLEATVVLPPGARELDAYWRYYALDPATNRLVGIYRHSGGSGWRRVYRLGEMMDVTDKGCDIVRIEYAIASGQFVRVACEPPPALTVAALLADPVACSYAKASVHAILEVTGGGQHGSAIRFSDRVGNSTGPSLAYDGVGLAAALGEESDELRRRVHDFLDDAAQHDFFALEVRGSARVRCEDDVPVGLTLTAIESLRERRFRRGDD